MGSLLVNIFDQSFDFASGSCPPITPCAALSVQGSERTVLSPFSSRQMCSRDAERKSKSGTVIGQRKEPLQIAFSLANHVAEYVARANKFAK